MTDSHPAVYAIESFDPARETCAQWAQRQLNTIAAQADGDPRLHRDRLLSLLDEMRETVIFETTISSNTGDLRFPLTGSDAADA